MKALSFILKYIRYRFRAKSAHGIHSPFVFELYNEVLKKKGDYYAFSAIEQLRKKLLASKKEIEVLDFGTGKSGKRRVSEMVSSSAKAPENCKTLFLLAYHFKPGTILELGTSAGISTLYLALANKHSTVFTIEGSPEIAALAQKNFRTLNTGNIKQTTGSFEEILPPLLGKLGAAGRRLDLCFFDGNHRKEPTLQYFTQCLRLAHNDSVFVFDDIHWSGEMEEAWEEIKKHPQATVTVDLFHLGLVFFRKEQAKQHFILK